MQQIENRPARSSRMNDLSGTTTIHGVAIKDLAGFAGKFAVWNCTCPRCGRDFVMRANCKNKQQSCGCLRTDLKTTPQKKRIRQYHYSTLRHYVVPEWKDFERFWQGIGVCLGEHERVYRRDHRFPIGPANYIAWDQRKLGNCGPESVLIWAADQYWSMKTAAELLGVSKQCVSQKLNRPGGLEQLQKDIAAKITPQSAAAD